MQSTRYCGYDKEKFGSKIQCIKPVEFSSCNYYEMKEDERELFRAFENAETHYMTLRTKYNWPAELARRCLPLSIATTFIQCGFEEDWNNFFNQRVLGVTGKPHPDAKYIAEMIYEKYKAAKQNN